MKKVELLLPGGSIDCIRAAVANGADAVYFGVGRFNARLKAKITLPMLDSIVSFLHDHGKKAYVTANTLVKNDEVKEFLQVVGGVDRSGADALIIQDVGMIPLIRKNFPKLAIHLSTQATITNTSSVPKGVKRIILPRELDFSEIRNFAEKFEVESFVHGALCFSYSGQCLFSSIVGGRSGNRGTCAQPCRKCYNNSYLMSTKDLCLLEEIPTLIHAGVKSLKVEGRLRSPLYVGTVARIYRKAIDAHYDGKFSVSEEDMNDLMLVFNREFTKGFGFEKTIVDSRMPMNRGLFLGKGRMGNIKLRHDLKKGDGIGIWTKMGMTGKKIAFNGKKGEVVEIEGLYDEPVYKTSSVDMKIDLGDELVIKEKKVKGMNVVIPGIKERKTQKGFRIHAICRTKKDAVDAKKAGADVVYCPPKLAQELGVGMLTPRIITDSELREFVDIIREMEFTYVLCGNPGLLPHLKGKKVFLDHSFNIFNDFDLDFYGIPAVVSPELTVNEVNAFNDKRIGILVHGFLTLMTTKEPLKAPELIDEEGRHFRVRKAGGYNEILNCKETGLFSKVLEYKGVNDFFIDTKEPGKYIRIYRKILSGEAFDDSKIRKGYTTGRMMKTIG